jgi:hypothetical protein
MGVCTLPKGEVMIERRNVKILNARVEGIFSIAAVLNLSEYPKSVSLEF